MSDGIEFRWILLENTVQDLIGDAIAETASLHGRKIGVGLESYGLPEACRALSNAFHASAACNVKTWARSLGRVVVDFEVPQLPTKAFRLEPGAILWSAKDSTALLVPLFRDPAGVVLVARGSHSERDITWRPECGLHLQHDTGLRIRAGRIRFIYRILHLERADLIEEEEDG